MSTTLYADRHSLLRLADPDDGATYEPIETLPLGGGAIPAIGAGLKAAELVSTLERAARAQRRHNAAAPADQRGYTIEIPDDLWCDHAGELTETEPAATLANPHHDAADEESDEPATIPVQVVALTIGYPGQHLSDLAASLRQVVRGAVSVNEQLLRAEGAERRVAGHGVVAFRVVVPGAEE